MNLKDILTSPIKYVKGRFLKDYPREFGDIPTDEGKIIEKSGRKIAVYKDRDGKIHQISPYCTHMGCVVEWDDKNKQWECPCHQSLFSKEGKVQKGPAKSDLKIINEYEDKTYIIEILEVEEITPNVKRFTTTKPKNYRFVPGQATKLAINKENFKKRFHPFTFTSLNEDNHIEFVIKGYPTDIYPDHSGVTEEIHKLGIGDQFIIKDPIGTIKYKGKGMFIAGGAGITPFISIFRDLSRRNILSGNMLMFSNKSKEDVIIENELREIFNDKNIVFILSREEVKGYEYGRLDTEMLKKYIGDFNQYFYICGPSEFEKDLTKMLLQLGAKKKKLVVEQW